jgi:hypothetical protein
VFFPRRKMLSSQILSYWRDYWRRWLNRYILGRSPETPFTKEELYEELNWANTSPEENRRRLDVLKAEFAVNDSIMNKQFDKTSALVSALSFIIAALTIGHFGGTGAAIKMICIAAMPALWAVAPRFKVLGFFKREDSGLRTGAVKTDWDEYYYWYAWNFRRENTTNVIEVLLLAAVVLTIIALGFVIVTV